MCEWNILLQTNSNFEGERQNKDDGTICNSSFGYFVKWKQRKNMDNNLGYTIDVLLCIWLTCNFEDIPIVKIKNMKLILFTPLPHLYQWSFYFSDSFFLEWEYNKKPRMIYINWIFWQIHLKNAVNACKKCCFVLFSAKRLL